MEQNKIIFAARLSVFYLFLLPFFTLNQQDEPKCEELKKNVSILTNKRSQVTLRVHLYASVYMYLSFESSSLFLSHFIHVNIISLNISQHLLILLFTHFINDVLFRELFIQKNHWF